MANGCCLEIQLPRQHRLLGYLGSVPAVPGPFFQVDSVDSLCLDCLDKAVVKVSQAVVVFGITQLRWITG